MFAKFIIGTITVGVAVRLMVPAPSTSPSVQPVVAVAKPVTAPEPAIDKVIERSDDGHVTRSGVHEVAGEERVAELARMLGGSSTDAALEHARDLMARARG